MPVDFRDYLDLETLLSGKLTGAWSKIAYSTYKSVSTALANNDFGKAADLANQLDLSVVGEDNHGFISTVLAGCVEHGAAVASGGPVHVHAQDFPTELSNATTQILQSLEVGATAYVRQRMLQLIAQSQEKEQLVQKAEAVRDFVSFRQDGDQYLQMVSALHTSRLSSWGFIAESDAIKQTTYKLSAMLDNRTSAYCRFCDGKIFTIEQARPIIEDALHTDNPDDLKVIQPWPRQNLEDQKMWPELSLADLVQRKMHVPPFHPGCRTMMVKVSQRIIGGKPESRPTELPEYKSSQSDFQALGVKMTIGQLNVWNDYANVNPAQSIAVLSGKSIPDLLKDTPGAGLIRVTAKGVISWRLPGVLAAYDPVVGGLKVSKIVGEVGDTLARARVLAKSVGATQVTADVRGLSAVEYLAAGYKPTAADWQAMRLSLAETLDGKLDDKLTATVGLLLSSNNEANALTLYSLAEDSQELRKALAAVKFTAVLKLSTTGLE